MQSIAFPVSSESVLVRPLRHHEMRALAALIQETSEAQFANRWREQSLGYREFLVAEVDGMLAGTVSIREVRDRRPTLHLFALEVATELRGQGVGSAIVHYVVEEALRRSRGEPRHRQLEQIGFGHVSRQVQDLMTGRGACAVS